MPDHDVDDDVSMMCDPLLAWAMQEFDADALGEALPSEVSVEEEVAHPGNAYLS
jgi:hypothetical protein